MIQDRLCLNTSVTHHEAQRLPCPQLKLTKYFWFSSQYQTPSFNTILTTLQHHRLSDYLMCSPWCSGKLVDIWAETTVMTAVLRSPVMLSTPNLPLSYSSSYLRTHILIKFSSLWLYNTLMFSVSNNRVSESKKHAEVPPFAVASITQPWRQCSANHLEECWQLYNLATIKSSVTLGEEGEWLVSKPLCIWPNVNRCLSPSSKSCWQQTQWHNIYNLVIAFRQLYQIWFEIEHKLCEKREKMNEKRNFEKKTSVKHMVLHSP